jgi:asparagine synthase (glutamine-hydrolysing)
MCGIAGYIGTKNFYPIKSKIKSCIKLMKLRGPDFQDFKEFELSQYRVLFCASRLSIIDTFERSNQPFEDENGILSFNGEIYNYLELKKDLLKKKIVFKTKSDTEVLLKYLNYYGIKKLDKVHGMWGFAYYSKKNNKFYLCRDKFGEKPVFYSFDKKNKNLIFGSNVNYIKELSTRAYKVDQEKIYDYLKYGFRSIYSENKTFFKRIKFVNPGELIEIDKNFKVKISNYLKLEKYKPKIKNYNLAKKILKNKIKEIIPKTFRSDVPIAFLLSGGVDSSIISYIAKKNLKRIKFYSLKVKNKNYDETKNIELIKKKLNLNHEFIIMNKDINKFNVIGELIEDTGFPLISSTNIAINEICKKVKKDGYKVIVTGNGADEIFSGYYAHHLSYLLSIKKSKTYKQKYMDWSNKTKPHIRTEILKNLDLYEKNINKNGYNFEVNLYKKYFKIIKKRKKPLKILNKKTNDIFIKHLDNDLFYDNFPTQAHSMDNISMHNSIESRMPYVNDHFYNLRNRMSKNFLIKNGLAKYILRDIFKNNLPKSVLFNSEKTGFYLPLRECVNLRSKKFINTIIKNKFLNKIIKLNVLRKKIIDNNLTQQDEKFIFLLYNAATFMKLNSK